MVMKIQNEQLKRKQELIRKENLSDEEKSELAKIEIFLKENYEEILNGEKIVEDLKPKTIEKKLTVIERKEKALEMIKEGREKNLDQKSIIKEIRRVLNVSYTYVYKLFKEE